MPPGGSCDQFGVVPYLWLAVDKTACDQGRDSDIRVRDHYIDKKMSLGAGGRLTSGWEANIRKNQPNNPTSI